MFKKYFINYFIAPLILLSDYSSDDPAVNETQSVDLVEPQKISHLDGLESTDYDFEYDSLEESLFENIEIQ